MITVKSRIQQQLFSRKAQLTFFGGLAAMTVLLVALQASSFPSRPTPTPVGGAPAPVATDVSVQAELSQTKLLQGQDGTVYVHLAIQTPERPERVGEKTPTDIVVVLDRSPSMLAANRLPFAKAAVLGLLEKLDAADRLGLIAFDGTASVYSELVEVTPAARETLTRLVKQLQVGSATNIGDGLLRARALLEQSPSPRVRKILLLSDGETNTGITDPQALAALASEISAKKVIVSTIGLGLGFNEALMASLADHGMGNYSYLEHVHTLGSILAKDLEEARRTYAESSELRLQLSTGVQLLDAAGYPLEKLGRDGAQLRLKTGQLSWSARKQLTLTFKTPTVTTGPVALGDIALRFSTNGMERQAGVKPEQLTLAVVEPVRQPEAVASIRSDVYRNSWLNNNLGRMRQQFYHWVKAGNKSKAQETLADYRRELQDAEAQSGLILSTKELEADIAQMEAGLDDAFRGPAAEQAEKRNRFSKSMQYLGRSEQRQ